MKKSSVKRKMTSFQPDADVAEMLELAKDVGGFDVKAFTNAAIRKYGPEILREMASERQQKLSEVLERLAPKKRDANKR